MGKYKTKAIQANLGIFTHIPAYSDISDIFKYIQNPGKFRTRRVFRTLVYSETWLTQDPGLFKNLAYSEPETYS